MSYRTALRAFLWLPPLSVLLLAAPAPGQAAGRSIRVETQEVRTGDAVTAALLVNGQEVARLAVAEGGRGPLQLAGSAANQLAAAYRSGDWELRSQSTDGAGRRWVLFLNSRALLVATDQEARVWDTEPQALAESWERKLVAALKLRPGKADSGPSALPATRTPSGSGVATQRQPARTPAAPSASASFGLPLAAIVTGSNPGSDVLGPAIEAGLRRKQGLPPAGSLTWKLAGKDAQPPRPQPGQRLAARLDYNAGGEVGTAELSVENLRLSVPRESLTLFSNSPESVYQPQLLYEAELPAQTAARLVYHHQNQAGSALLFVVRVLDGGEGGALHVIPGTASPDINTFFVGFRSAENFWRNMNSGNGFVAVLPPAGPLNLLSQELSAGYTASGYMKLSNLGQAPLRVEVLCAPAGWQLPETALRAAPSTTRSVFDAPFLAVDKSYHTGGQWLYLRLGVDRPRSSTDDAVLHGCYGMTHSYNVELVNGGTEPALAFVVLRASAGEVKGQFFINDEYLATPLVASGEELLLREIPLPPGKTTLLKIKAIALNGGFYPASIIIRETRLP